MPVGTLTRSHCLGIRDTIPTPLPSFYFIVFLGGGGRVGGKERCQLLRRRLPLAVILI